MSTQSVSDSAEFNRLLGRRNQLNFQAQSTDFAVLSQKNKKPKKGKNYKDLEQLDARLSDLYYDLQDELSYLNEDLQIISESYQYYAGEVPPEPNLYDIDKQQLKQLSQRFNQNLEDDNILPELGILYQELKLFTHLTAEIQGQQSANQKQVKLLRQVEAQLKQHSKWLRNNLYVLEKGNPESIASFNSLLDEQIQIFEELLLEFEQDEFGIQALTTDQLKQKVQQILNSLYRARNAETISQKLKDDERQLQMPKNAD